MESTLPNRKPQSQNEPVSRPKRWNILDGGARGGNTRVGKHRKSSASWLGKKAQRGFRGYPIATIALYGPTA